MNPFQTIEREEVGIKLIVTPQISKGDAIRLEIEQESSKLQNTASQRGTADVITSISKLATNILVQDGELMVLGGLIDDQYGEQESKVPFLGSIPLLGALFRSSGETTGNNVLMIFIRPTILRDAETANALSDARYSHLISIDQDEDGNNGVIGEQMEEFRNQEPPVPASPIAPSTVPVIPDQQPEAAVVPELPPIVLIQEEEQAVELPLILPSEEPAEEIVNTSYQQQLSELLGHSDNTAFIQLFGTYAENEAVEFVEDYAINDSFYYLKSTLNGRDWYVVVYGGFVSERAAINEQANLSDKLTEGGPWVRGMGNIRSTVTP